MAIPMIDLGIRHLTLGQMRKLDVAQLREQTSMVMDSENKPAVVVLPVPVFVEMQAAMDAQGQAGT